MLYIIYGMTDGFQFIPKTNRIKQNALCTSPISLHSCAPHRVGHTLRRHLAQALHALGDGPHHLWPIQAVEKTLRHGKKKTKIYRS